MDSDGNGSDIVMGYVDGSANVNDYFAQSKSQPELDEQQNLFFTDGRKKLNFKNLPLELN